MDKDQMDLFDGTDVPLSRDEEIKGMIFLVVVVGMFLWGLKVFWDSGSDCRSAARDGDVSYVHYNCR